jgi:hypothetical protein
MFPCPLIAAFILVYREEKLGGIKRLLKRVFDIKRIKQKIWREATTIPREVMQNARSFSSIKVIVCWRADSAS